ncbi:MAG: CHRD domain-containing protein [Actinomycetota bacterium]
MFETSTTRFARWQRPLIVMLAAALVWAMPAVALADDDDDDDESERTGAVQLVARLRPGQEVQTPAVVSDAEGRATFWLQGSTVAFRLRWEDLTTNTLAGHIHCGAAGVNGPVGVTLFTGPKGTEAVVNGSFTAPDVGNGCGWQNLGAVLSAMLSGNAYVNVHTTRYPAGEIRGQIRVVTDD